VYNLGHIKLGVMKGHVIYGVRNQTKSRAPNDVFFKEGARSESALGNRVTEDPPDRHPRHEAGLLVHITTISQLLKSFVFFIQIFEKYVTVTRLFFFILGREKFTVGSTLGSIKTHRIIELVHNSTTSTISYKACTLACMWVTPWTIKATIFTRRDGVHYNLDPKFVHPHSARIWPLANLARAAV